MSFSFQNKSALCVNWERKSFSKAFELIRQTRKLKSSEIEEIGSFPVIDQGQGLIAGFTNDADGLINGGEGLIIFGDHTRELKFVDFDFVPGADGIKILKPVKALDLRFAFYFLQSQDLPNEGYSRHFKYLKALEVPLPPLGEQKRIAGILDEADRVRKKTQALIDKYDELAQSLFLDMFGDPVTNPKGWEVKPLGKLVHMKAGKFVRASDISEECEEGMNPCYGGNGLRGFVESTTHEGEFVLIGRQGALCGNVKLVKGLFHATEHAVVCTPSLSYESEWFYHLLVMLDLNRFATGAAQPGLNVGTLNEISVPHPPQELQQSFSLMIKNLTSQKELTDQGSQESQEIFQALLQKAFKGELT